MDITRYKLTERRSDSPLGRIEKVCNVRKLVSPDTASRRVVVQNSVAVQPLDDAVLHLHRYVPYDAQQLDGAISLVVLVSQWLAQGVHYLDGRC